MSIRPRLIAVATLMLGLSLLAFASGTAGAARPGEVDSLEVENRCLDRAISAAPALGVILRLCPEGFGSRQSTIANLLPNGEAFDEATIGSSGGPILAGPAGEIWATGSSGMTTEIDWIGTDGSVLEVPIATETKDEEIFLHGLALDGEGALWAAVGDEKSFGFGDDDLGGELVRIAGDGSVARWSLPESIEPQGLVVGPEGDIWFTGIRGRYSAEHSYSPGVGYVGRMTPAGELALYRVPGRWTEPEAIAVGPDGRIWFLETGTDRLASIGTDGTFGSRYDLRFGYIPSASIPRSQGDLVFGPEGDAWIVASRGLIRVTPEGQETLFTQAVGDTLAIGPEGDVWSDSWGRVSRLVPGAPGIDVQRIAADRRSGTVAVRLACGGSRSGCVGTLNLALTVPRRSHLPAGASDESPIRFVHVAYSLGAESRRTLRFRIPGETFVLARRFQPPDQEGGPALDGTVTATVTGGPTLQHKISVPFAPHSAGSAARLAK